MGKTYVSPSGTAKELQKIYVGNSNNVAQEIKRTYIGDSNGVARMVFGPPYPPPVVSPLYLIQNGASINTEITGGWQSRSYNIYNVSGGAYSPRITWKHGWTGGTGVELFVPDTSSDKAQSGIFETQNDIDLTYYNTIKCYGCCYGSGISSETKWAKLCILNRSTNAIIKSTNFANKINSRSEISIDISDLTGFYDICIAQRSTGIKSTYGEYNYIVLEV